MKKKFVIVGGAVIAITGLIFWLKRRPGMPKGAVPVKDFDLNRYLGKWYEIARLNYHFEKNLNNATAEYSLNDDGSVKVINRGYNYYKNEWETIEGKAVFRNKEHIAKLKVSFFWPFFSGYNVIAIDTAYQYALVAGNDLNYLWILSRKKTVPEDIRRNFLKQAASLGYHTGKLIWTEHSRD